MNVLFSSKLTILEKGFIEKKLCHKHLKLKKVEK